MKIDIFLSFVAAHPKEIHDKFICIIIIDIFIYLKYFIENILNFRREM